MGEWTAIDKSYSLNWYSHFARGYLVHNIISAPEQVSRANHSSGLRWPGQVTRGRVSTDLRLPQSDHATASDVVQQVCPAGGGGRLDAEAELEKR